MKLLKSKIICTKSRNPVEPEARGDKPALLVLLQTLRTTRAVARALRTTPGHRKVSGNSSVGEGV